MKLIDKDALVAEIERRIADNKKDIERAYHKNLEDYFEGYEDALTLFKEQFLDTLEVKENNLVEELDYDDYMSFFKEHPEYANGDWGFEETWTFAQYCYKLGFKAQKGE